MGEIEERAGQMLLDMEEEKTRRERELQSLGEQLRQAAAKSQMTDSELQYLLIPCGEFNESPFDSSLALIDSDVLPDTGIHVMDFYLQLCFIFIFTSVALLASLILHPDFCRESLRA